MTHEINHRPRKRRRTQMKRTKQTSKHPNRWTRVILANDNDLMWTMEMTRTKMMLRRNKDEDEMMWLRKNHNQLSQAALFELNPKIDARRQHASDQTMNLVVMNLAIIDRTRATINTATKNRPLTAKIVSLRHERLWGDRRVSLWRYV